MSIDLKTQLHDYFEYVDEGQGTVDLEAVALTAEPVKLTPRRRTRTVPGWAYGVASAIVALLLVGGLAWLIWPITPASPVISQPPSPSVTAAPDSSGNGWMRVDDEVAFPRRVGAISSVVVGGPGLVAVGWYAPPFDDQAGTTPTTPPPTLVQPDPQDDAAVWTSVDGLTWSRVVHDDSVFGGLGDQRIHDVAVGASGMLVAVGDLVWVSPDGLSWSRVYEDPAGASMSAVTAAGPGWVAVGSHEGEGVVWASTDGVDWSQVPDPDGVFRGAAINDVTVGPSGLLVAVGAGEGECLHPSEVSAEENCGSVVWTSEVGTKWARTYSENGAGIRAITQAGPGLVAVGWGGAVWTSPDGAQWTRETTGEQTFAGTSDFLETVESGELGVVIVAQGGLGNTGFWTSTNGSAWSRLPSDPFLSMTSASSDGEEFPVSGTVNDVLVTSWGLVVVGSETIHEQNFVLGERAVVWVRVDSQ